VDLTVGKREIFVGLEWKKQKGIRKKLEEQKDKRLHDNNEE